MREKKRDEFYTVSREDYLIAVYVLKREKGKVRSVDVAKMLGYKKSSVSNGIHLLMQKKLLVMDGQRYLEFTGEGEKKAKEIYRRYKTVKDYLCHVAGVQEKTAEADSRRLEHLISDETAARLRECLRKGKNMKIILSDGTIKETTEALQVIRHSTAHILAQAVKRLYPETKLAIGPAIENGFYYDFDREEGFSAEDLSKLEGEMEKIVKENLPVKPFILEKEEALRLMEERGEPYKTELIENLPEGEPISFYQQGEFVDLCAGPHILYTKGVKAFKLLSVAGAYWRGDEKNKMLTRIYGTAFAGKDQLDSYLEMIEEAKKRDHRKLGKELGLFMFAQEGPGFPFFLPKGVTLKNTLIEYWRQIHQREGYLEVSTPMILSRKLWETSGHWEHYKENMYTTEIDGEDFAVKPMNCPGGMLVYKNQMHSYRDFPMRIGELGVVHRHEKSGQLHGLMRVRCFTQDDAHIFMREDQIEEEIKNVTRLIDEVYRKFGFDYFVELSTRPENSMGSDEEWEMATNGLRRALEEMKMDYTVNEGDGAFYGPKIDFHLRDSLGRTWQCGTIQLDFQLPQRFQLEYMGKDGKKRQPIMLHRVCFGSIERFIGILIEHYGGKFPLWLSPVQVKVIPVSEKNMKYAQDVSERLKKQGIRTELDERDEKLGHKIRQAQLEKIPFMLILGEREAEAGTVSVRSRDKGDLGTFELRDFVERLHEDGAAPAGGKG